MESAVLIALALVALTFLFHFKVLVWLGRITPLIGTQSQYGVLLIVLVLFFAHICEIGFYAAAYAVSVINLKLGSFEGGDITGAMAYFYYSGVIYTSLGLGDIHPHGHIRFITAIEALNGLLLIAWSASFTFMVMGKVWVVAPPKESNTIYQKEDLGGKHDETKRD